MFPLTPYTLLITISLNCISASLFCQLPDTDIWLTDIQTEKDTIRFTSPVNITSRPGYDNQPAFSPDGKYILFTSIRNDNQSDIYKCDMETKSISQYTNTTTSEYSPTFMPDGENISVVMVESDSTQRLWKFPIKGGLPALIMDKVDSIGYHCWIDTTTVILFLITKPATLQLVDLKTQKGTIMADSIGRSLHLINRKLFYSRNKEIYSSDFKKSVFETNKELDGEDFCFLKTDQIIMGSQSKLFFKNLNIKEKEWQEIANFASYGIKNIRRIAVSRDGKKLALVAESE